MGNYLYADTEAKGENKDLVKYFRKRTRLHEVLASFKLYVKDYYPKLNLEYEEFDDCFCGLLNNTRPVFDIL